SLLNPACRIVIFDRHTYLREPAEHAFIQARRLSDDAAAESAPRRPRTSVSVQNPPTSFVLSPPHEYGLSFPGWLMPALPRGTATSTTSSRSRLPTISTTPPFAPPWQTDTDEGA